MDLTDQQLLELLELMADLEAQEVKDMGIEIESAQDLCKRIYKELNRDS